jgi:hypothetical protein
MISIITILEIKEALNKASDAPEIIRYPGYSLTIQQMITIVVNLIYC